MPFAWGPWAMNDVETPDSAAALLTALYSSTPGPFSAIQRVPDIFMVIASWPMFIGTVISTA